MDSMTVPPRVSANIRCVLVNMKNCCLNVRDCRALLPLLANEGNDEDEEEEEVVVVVGGVAVEEVEEVADVAPLCEWHRVSRKPEEKTGDKSSALIQPLVSIPPPHHTTITSNGAGLGHKHS